MLLNLIDHLPRNCWYSEAVAGDEEHARMLLEHQQRQQQSSGEPYRPPMSTWSPEVAMLADLIDEVRGLRAATIAAAGGKPPTPTPYPRPGTMMEKVRRDQRRQKHAELVKRVLRREEDA